MARELKGSRILGKREITVLAAAAIAVVIFSYSWFTRWIGGKYFYSVEYIRAALGDDYLEEACASALLVKNPWTALETQDWFKLQRCAGNRDGFDRQGELTSVVSV